MKSRPCTSENPEKGIRRHPDDLGWRASTQWCGERRRCEARDAENGGREQSYRAACDWLRAANRAMGKPETSRWVCGPDERTASGVLGVEVRRGGKEVRATWLRPDGVRENRCIPPGRPLQERIEAAASLWGEAMFGSP